MRDDGGSHENVFWQNFDEATNEYFDDELALMELIEFVRLSVQMIYDEFRSDS